MDTKEFQLIAEQLACPSGDDGIEISQRMSEANSFITQKSIDLLGPGIGECIAEIGPGNGALSERIIHSIGKEGQYFGFEHSPLIARKLELRLKKIKQAQINIFMQDFLKVPVSRNTVDGVIAVNVLYFIDDLNAFFKMITHWLKPSGRIVFGIRSLKSLQSMPYTRFGFKIRTLDEIAESLNKSGYINFDCAYFDEGISQQCKIEIPLDFLVIRSFLDNMLPVSRS